MLSSTRASPVVCRHRWSRRESRNDEERLLGRRRPRHYGAGVFTVVGPGRGSNQAGGLHPGSERNSVDETRDRRDDGRHWDACSPRRNPSHARDDGYRITDVLVEEGARVERGQVLARLSHDLIDRQIAQQKAKIDKASAAVPQAENNIEQAEAAETEARLGFERANQLMQSGNTTAVTIEGRTSALRQAEGRTAFARNGLVSAKADLEQAKAVGDELTCALPERRSRYGGRDRQSTDRPHRHGGVDFIGAAVPADRTWRDRA